MTLTYLMIALAGFVTGWLLALASDVLPRYAVTTPAAVTSTGSGRYLPATLRYLRGDRSPNLRLHLALEWLLPGLALLLTWRIGLNPALLPGLAALALFMLIAVIDLKYRLILNIITYPALVIALALQVILVPAQMLPVLVGGGFAFSIFYLVARLKPGDLGGGDVKLAALIGVVFGFPSMLWALIVGGTAGALAAIYLVVTGTATLKRRIPYAPFLCAGAIVALLFNPLTIG